MIISQAANLRREELSVVEGELKKSRMRMGTMLARIVSGYPAKVYNFRYLEVQGLAMSRSLGDNISKPIGVTHEP